jgi:methionyl-tRNA formyltransferase
MAGEVTVTDAMTASDLHDMLAQAGATLMARAIDALERGDLKLTPQPAEGVTYAAKIDKNEARIDWTKPAREVLRHCHGLSPFPGAWSEVEIDGQPVRLKVLRCEVARGRAAPGEAVDAALTIACGSDAVRILELQREGKRPMTAAEFLRGTRLPAGSRMR